MYPYDFFNIEGFNLYNLLIAIGVFLALMLFDRLATVRKIPFKVTKFYLILGICSILLGFFSAMLFQSFYNWIASGCTFWEWRGMTFLGGLIGGVIVFFAGYFIFAKDKNKTMLPLVVEIGPPCITIGHAVGRIGCFFSGCCYGIETDSFLGVHFLTASGSRLPTQLFEAAFLFIITFIMIWMNKKKINYALSAYLVGYGVFRFLIEFLRDDARGSLGSSLFSPSQIQSFLLIGIGIALFAIKMLHDKGVLHVKLLEGLDTDTAVSNADAKSAGTQTAEDADDKSNDVPRQN